MKRATRTVIVPTNGEVEAIARVVDAANDLKRKADYSKFARHPDGRLYSEAEEAYRMIADTLAPMLTRAYDMGHKDMSELHQLMSDDRDARETQVRFDQATVDINTLLELLYSTDGFKTMDDESKQLAKNIAHDWPLLKALEMTRHER